MHKALWQTANSDGSVSCGLCPRRCRISPNHSGYCGVRTNLDGTLYSECYRRPVALQVDPIEKKPFNWFLPGTLAFSIGTFGCNLGCEFCQNAQLSRGNYRRFQSEEVSAETIVELAGKHHCSSIAFTYNEPTVFAEYAIEIAQTAHKAGLTTLLVSNGYITLEAAHDLYPLIDAANIDLKSGDKEFYQTLCDGNLAPVLDACDYYKNICKGHLELTNLIIPGKNDSVAQIDNLLNRIENRLGIDTPLHFSAYFPAYRMTIQPTPPETLYRIQGQAFDHGFKHVCLGNI